MDKKRFDDWCHRFKSQIVIFFEANHELDDMYGSVWDAWHDACDEMNRYIKSDWKRFGRREAWYGVNKLEKEIKWAEKEFTNLINWIEACRPWWSPFLSYYSKADEAWVKLINMTYKFEKELLTRGSGRGS